MVVVWNGVCAGQARQKGEGEGHGGGAGHEDVDDGRLAAPRLGIVQLLSEGEEVIGEGQELWEVGLGGVQKGTGGYARLEQVEDCEGVPRVFGLEGGR